jgi:hypothetical protein
VQHSTSRRLRSLTSAPHSNEGEGHGAQSKLGGVKRAVSCATVWDPIVG